MREEKRKKRERAVWGIGDRRSLRRKIRDVSRGVDRQPIR